MPNYKLLPKQKELFEIPHDNQLDVCIYQGGYGSGKTWCGSLLGLMLAIKYPGSKGLVGAAVNIEIPRSKVKISVDKPYLDNIIKAIDAAIKKYHVA